MTTKNIEKNKAIEGELIPYKDPKLLANFLATKSTVKIAEAITGFLATERSGKFLVAGRVIQGALKSNFYEQFGKEFKYLSEKGKIKADYADTKKNKYGFQSLSELLAFIDNEDPDQDRFEAVKSVFYYLNSSNKEKGANEVLKYKLFQLIKMISSTQILLLKAVYEFNQKEDREVSNVLAKWRINIAIQMGYGLPELIENDEKILVDYKLLTPTIRGQDKVIDPNDSRLTRLGIKLYGILSDYSFDNIKSEDVKK